MNRKLAPRCPRCGFRCKALKKHMNVCGIPRHARPTRANRLRVAHSLSRQQAQAQAVDARPTTAPLRAYGYLNQWVCGDCNHVLTTLDTSEGTTPYMLSCVVGGCRGTMVSRGYQVSANCAQTYTHVWRNPTVDEYERMSAIERDHADAGGLFLHPRPDRHG